MSKGVACSCPSPSARRWYVAARKQNRSAFNGYRVTTSAYSEVRCPPCRGRWRTSAKYVDQLPDAPPQPAPVAHPSQVPGT